MDASHSGSMVGRFWLQAAAFLLLAACSVDNRPGYGVMLQVDTDLATPKDLDRVHIEVTQSGTTVLDEFYAIGTDDEPPPLEIPISYRGDSAPATFKVVGYRAGEPRVERLAITTIPSSRWAIIRMRLQYLCLGQWPLRAAKAARQVTPACRVSANLRRCPRARCLTIRCPSRSRRAVRRARAVSQPVSMCCAVSPTRAKRSSTPTARSRSTLR